MDPPPLVTALFFLFFIRRGPSYQWPNPTYALPSLDIEGVLLGFSDPTTARQDYKVEIGLRLPSAPLPFFFFFLPLIIFFSLGAFPVPWLPKPNQPFPSSRSPPSLVEYHLLCGVFGNPWTTLNFFFLSFLLFCM